MKLEESSIIVERRYKKVYRCGGSILKVFDETHPKSDVFNEALLTARIEETELDIPSVKGVSRDRREMGARDRVQRGEDAGRADAV